MALYYAFMYVWSFIVGPTASETWMRLPSVLFGVAGLWALYRLGTRLHGPGTGLLAAGFAAVNAYHIEMSEEARAYTLWALLATLSWDALVDALDTGERRAWLRYVAWTTVAFYAHFFTLFVIAAQVVVVAMRSRVSEWRVLVVCGLLVALSGLWMTLFFPRPSGPNELLYAFRLVFGSAMVVSIILGFEAIIRRRDVLGHRAWMMRAYAIGLGAGTQVLTGMVETLIVGQPSALSTALAQGAGWVINLIVAEWAIRRLPAQRARSAAASHSKREQPGAAR